MLLSSYSHVIRKFWFTFIFRYSYLSPSLWGIPRLLYSKSHFNLIRSTAIWRPNRVWFQFCSHLSSPTAIISYSSRSFSGICSTRRSPSPSLQLSIYLFIHSHFISGSFSVVTSTIYLQFLCLSPVCPTPEILQHQLYVESTTSPISRPQSATSPDFSLTVPSNSKQLISCGGAVKETVPRSVIIVFTLLLVGSSVCSSSFMNHIITCEEHHDQQHTFRIILHFCMWIA